MFAPFSKCDKCLGLANTAEAGSDLIDALFYLWLFEQKSMFKDLVAVHFEIRQVVLDVHQFVTLLSRGSHSRSNIQDL